MKNILKKITSICSVVVLLFSLVSCGIGKKNEEKEKSKTGGSSSPEAAMHSLVLGFYNGDVDEICKATAPSEVWDYVCKETGLSKERVLKRLLQFDTLEEMSKGLKSSLKESDINKVKIKEQSEGNDNYYHDFNHVMSKAGIEEDIKHIYIIDEGSPDYDFPDIWQGWAYEINGNWYFGEEFILEDLFNVVLEGYSALPEEVEEDEDDDNDYDYEDYNDYNDYDKTNDYSYDEAENLCADSSNWTNWSSEENGCEANLKVLSDGAALEITKSHGSGGEQTYYYYNQLKYENITLEKNATYLVEFDIEVTDDIGFEYTVQQNYDPYYPYVDEINTVSSSQIKHFSLEFTMTESDNDAAIAFNLNSPDVAVPYTVSIHNLSLTRIS